MCCLVRNQIAWGKLAFLIQVHLHSEVGVVEMSKKSGRKLQKSCTDPPLKAPTGFLIGRGVATSANRREEVESCLEVRRATEGVERLRIARIREAMTAVQ